MNELKRRLSRRSVASRNPGKYNKPAKYWHVDKRNSHGGFWSTSAVK